jgi:hypothetical protein
MGATGFDVSRFSAMKARLPPIAGIMERLSRRMHEVVGI